jgi:hypothetical protein
MLFAINLIIALFIGRGLLKKLYKTLQKFTFYVQMLRNVKMDFCSDLEKRDKKKLIFGPAIEVRIGR